MMDLEPLREAARLMRERGEPPWHLAVADWLDTGANPYACVAREPMFRVADAYLNAQVDVDAYERGRADRAPIKGD